ncbi:MAG: HD domain-containing protein [Sphingobacteriia bacterium]|nr:HD domain-containing protein [Sphingobacteriia bacterium]
MENKEKDELLRLIVAPYIQKATALIGKARKVGGNQFRHMMATFTILIDYHYTNHVLLKASLIHDLFEDIPETNKSEILELTDGAKVLELVDEVTRLPSETKEEYLTKILIRGTKEAKILKVADRISNLTDLHLDVIIEEKMASYLEQSMKYIYPMALDVNANMAIEIKDLVERRNFYLDTYRKGKMQL